MMFLLPCDLAYPLYLYRLHRSDLLYLFHLNCSLEALYFIRPSYRDSPPRCVNSDRFIGLRHSTRLGERRPDVDDQTRAALTAVPLDSITPMFVEVLYNQGSRRGPYRFSDGGISAMWRRDPSRSSNRHLRENAAGSIEALQQQRTQGTIPRRRTLTDGRQDDMRFFIGCLANPSIYT